MYEKSNLTATIQSADYCEQDLKEKFLKDGRRLKRLFYAETKRKSLILSSANSARNPRESYYLERKMIPRVIWIGDSSAYYWAARALN
jgi:hypothetical protein